MTTPNPISAEAVQLAYAIQDRSIDYPTTAQRLALLVIQLYAPSETRTMTTQDGLVIRHGALKPRPPIATSEPPKPPAKAKRRPKQIKKAKR